MHGRSVTVPRKTSKKPAMQHKAKPRDVVIVRRPASPARTAKTFGVGTKRSKNIDAMVAKAAG